MYEMPPSLGGRPCKVPKLQEQKAASGGGGGHGIPAARAMREVESEREPEEGGDDRPGMKRIVGEVLSVLAFLVLIMLAVYGADGLANWLKGLVGM